MSQTVKMDVICIGDECKNCRYLDIEIAHRVTYEFDTGMETKNVCSCKEYEKCECIMNNLRKNSTADSEEKDGV